MADAPQMQDPPPGRQTPPGNEYGVYDRRSAERINEAVHWTLGTYRQRPRYGKRHRASGTGAMLAKVGASAISARSGTTVSSGTVTLTTIASGTLTAGATTVTAYNLLNKTIAANSYVVVAFASGSWVVVAVDDCGHLS